MKKIESTNRNIVIMNTSIVLFTQVIQVVFGFIVRKVFIDTLGIYYLGYNSVFSNILQFLNLADLGIGIAITGFLYKPIAEENTEHIKALMHIYKKVYKIIGIMVAIIGVIISFFLPVFINDAIYDYSYLKILYFINLFGTVSTYYLAYKRTLLIACQKSYITSIIDVISYLISSIIQIVILLVYPNYIIYLIINVLKSIVSNFIISIKCSKQYSYIHDKASLEIINKYKKEIIDYVKDVFIARVGAYIFNSTDNLIISTFKGSLITGILSNYTMITVQITIVISQILSAVQSTFGIYLNTVKEKKKQLKMIDNYLFINYYIGNFCMICILFLIQPFIELFFGKKYLLAMTTIALLAINLMLSILMQLPSQLFVIFKLFKYDKYIISVSALLNIIISILLVKIIGIDGVLIGTLITSLIYLYSRLYIVCKNIYMISIKQYIIKLGFYYTISGLSIFIIFYSTSWISHVTIYNFLIKIIIVVVESLIIPILLCYKSDEFQFLYHTFIQKKFKLRGKC